MLLLFTDQDWVPTWLVLITFGYAKGEGREEAKSVFLIFRSVFSTQQNCPETACPILGNTRQRDFYKNKSPSQIYKVRKKNCLGLLP